SSPPFWPGRVSRVPKRCQRAGSRFGRREELCDIRRAARPVRDMKGTLALLAKFCVTLAIFVGIFLEFGGGYRAVRTARLRQPGAFEAANPAFPSLLGRLRVRLRGTSLPPPRLPVPIEKVCLAAVKLVGVFANVWRWQILLRGQGIDLGFGYLANSYFIGRYFGIVTPSTMGLDAWRLYDTIRLTRRPVECTAVLVVERVLGLVGIFSVILVLLPFARDITQRQSLGELVAGTRWLLAATTLLGVLLLLQPGWFRGLLRLAPRGR